QLRIHASQRGEIDDGTPTHFLPYAGSDVNRAEIFRMLQKRRSCAAKKRNDVVEYAATERKLPDEAANYHQGDKVRDVGHGLHRALKPLRVQLVEHERQEDGHGKAPQ